MRRRRLARLLAAAGVMLVLAACAGGGATARKPGLYDLGEGRWRAVGTLRHDDLEGGFWAVYDTVPGRTGGTRLAVVRNAEELGARKLDGRYVEAIGLREDGPSIRMAGPEIEASTLREIPTP